MRFKRKFGNVFTRPKKLRLFVVEKNKKVKSDTQFVRVQIAATFPEQNSEFRNETT